MWHSHHGRGAIWLAHADRRADTSLLCCATSGVLSSSRAGSIAHHIITQKAWERQPGAAPAKGLSSGAALEKMRREFRLVVYCPVPMRGADTPARGCLARWRRKEKSLGEATLPPRIWAGPGKRVRVSHASLTFARHGSILWILSDRGRVLTHSTSSQGCCDLVTQGLSWPLRFFVPGKLS